MTCDCHCLIPDLFFWILTAWCLAETVLCVAEMILRHKQNKSDDYEPGAYRKTVLGEDA